MKYQECKCQGPMCNSPATVLVVMEPDTPNERRIPMCVECARARKETAREYEREVLITTLE